MGIQNAPCSMSSCAGVGCRRGGVRVSSGVAKEGEAMIDETQLALARLLTRQAAMALDDARRYLDLHQPVLAGRVFDAWEQATALDEALKEEMKPCVGRSE